MSKQTRQSNRACAETTVFSAPVASAECREHWDDAIVDRGNGRSVSNFIVAIKDQSVAVGVAVKKIVLNPVHEETNIKTQIRDKKFKENEVFGIFIEQMIAKDELGELRETDKLVLSSKYLTFLCSSRVSQFSNNKENS